MILWILDLIFDFDHEIWQSTPVQIVLTVAGCIVAFLGFIYGLSLIVPK